MLKYGLSTCINDPRSMQYLHEMMYFEIQQHKMVIKMIAYRLGQQMTPQVVCLAWFDNLFPVFYFVWVSSNREIAVWQMDQYQP